MSNSSDATLEGPLRQRRPSLRAGCKHGALVDGPQLGTRVTAEGTRSVLNPET